MVTLGQIQEAHDTYGHKDSLADFLLALRAIGVLSCDSFLSDGHSEYECENGQRLISEAVHAEISVNDTVDQKRFLNTLKLVESGAIDYLEMSKALAASGVDRWRFNTLNLGITYIDTAGNVMLKEIVGS